MLTSISVVTLSLSKYEYIPRITITTKIPFEHFKGFFDVIAKNGKKAGSLEL